MATRPQRPGHASSASTVAGTRGDSDVASEPTLVVLAEDMSDRDFTRHMNKRHRDSLGGLNRLWNSSIIGMWRTFHGHLHRWRIYKDHEHG